MPPGAELFLKTFMGFIVFGCLLFLAYIATRYIGQKTSTAMKGNYMKVIETLPLGIDKSIYLVQVGEKYILIASAGKSIEFLTEVDIELSEDKVEEKPQQFDFYNMFLKHVRKMTASQRILSDDSLHQDRNSGSLARNVSTLKNSINRLAGKYRGEDENLNE